MTHGTWKRYGVINYMCYLHVDINAYFATLLQQETPCLRGKPLAITKDLGRTCVIAASKEAKLHGIKTGVTVVEAKRLVPDITVIPADFSMYLSATKQLKTLFESLTPDVEIFSLDEAFIPFDPLRRLYPTPEKFGHVIQEKIATTLGEWVTCNVGIGPTRFLAKMRGETSPKGSISRVSTETAPALLSTTQFSDVCGIGSRLARRLACFGVTVPYQINFIPKDVLSVSFGPFWSVQLQKMAVGQEPLFLERLNVEQPHMKSVGRSITGFSLCHDATSIRHTLYNLAEEVMYKVRAQNLAGRKISVSLYGHDTRWGKHMTLKRFVRHSKEFSSIILDSLLPQWQEPFPVIKFAVYLGLLKPWPETPQQLWPEWWKQEQLEQARDSLTKKYGLFTVTGGLLLNKPKIRPEVTGFLGDKQFQFLEPA